MLLFSLHWVIIAQFGYFLKGQFMWEKNSEEEILELN